MANPNSHYSQSEGIRLIETAVQELGPIFTLEKLKPIAERQGLSVYHLRKLTSVLASSGRIEILKRGTYAVHGPLFTGEISPFAVADALVQPAAVSHWSALAHHGFTTQMPHMVQASTPRKVITPEMRMGAADRPRGRAIWKALGIEVEYLHIQEKHFFGHQKIWVNSWQQVFITDPERTALDLIARPAVFGGTSAAIEILEDNLPRIDVRGLIQYAMRYDTGALIKRLGWLLERFGVSSEEFVPLQSYPVTTYYRLDPQSPPGQHYHSRWHIIDNLSEKHHA